MKNFYESFSLEKIGEKAKKAMLTTVAICLTFVGLNAQVAGESCDNPSVIVDLPFTDSGNTSTYGNNYGNPDVPGVAPNAVTTGTGSEYYLSGNEVVYSYTPANEEVITISTTNDDDWVGLWVFTGCPFASTVGYHTATGGATRLIQDLPVNSGTTYYIVISTWDAPLSTDYSIEITKLMDCTGTPDAGTISGPSLACVSDDFIISMDTPIGNVSGIQYQWQSSTDGGTTWTDIPGANTSSLAVSGMAQATDYRLEVTCTASNESDISNEISVAFGTGADCYCTPSTTYTGDYLSAISSDGGVTDINYTASSQPSGSYANETGQSFSVLEGDDLTITTSYVGGGNGVNIWVDWNHDGVFDASEKVASLANGSATKTQTFNIPLGTTAGDYRVRVRGQYGSTADPAPCGELNYGSTVDFELTVIELTACTGTPDAGTVVGPSTFGVCLDDPFTINMEGYTIGGGLTFQWEGRAAGSSDPWQNAGTTPNLDYPAGAFTGDLEFQLTVTCTNSGEFDVSDLITVTLNPAHECYCDVSTTYGEYLSSITSSGALTNISYSASAQPSGSYADETAQTFEIYEGDELTINTSYSSGAYGVNIWIDFNKDGVFDASEKVASLANSSSSKTQTFNIPLGTPGDNYRVRVRGQWGSSADPAPCGEVNYGSTVDFNLTVIELTACDGTPDAGVVVGPSTFGNCGDQPFTINMEGYTIGGGVTYQWEGRAAGSSDPWQNAGTTPNLNYPAGAFTGDLEFQLTVTCTNSGEFDVSDIITVTLKSPEECYCTPAATNSSYYINNFETAGSIENISNMNSGFSTGGYGDHTDQKVKEEINEDVNFTVSFGGTTTYGFRIWVDWNQNGVFEASEVAYQSSSYASSHSASFAVPGDALEGETRMRIVGHYLNSSGDVDPCATNHTYGEFEDYTFEVVIPDCPKPANLVVSGSSSSSFDIEWTAIGATSAWNVSWGEVGYDPDGTDAVGTASVATTNYTITNLDPQTVYDIYVQSDCEEDDDGVSFWTKTSAMTECVSTTVPYFLDFEDVEVPELPACTDVEAIAGNQWTTVLLDNYGFEGNVLRYLYTSTAANSWFYTQGIELEAGVDYVLTYKYGKQSATWTEGLRVAYGTSPVATSMLDTLALHEDISGTTAHIDTVVFTPDADGVYYLGFQAISPSSQLYLFVDDILVDFCNINPGMTGSIEACRLDGTIDLNTVITSDYTHGTWSFSDNESLVNGSDFNVAGLPGGVYNVDYVVSNACTADTTIATIEVFPPSSAGHGGTITVCKNSPINLYDGLSGNADMGGDWFDYNGNQLPNSQPTSSGIPGSFNYKYIVSNGVCPADTAIIEVIVDPSCDGGVSVGSEEFVELSVYPNPATTVLNIDNPSSTSNLRLEMIDMNGRVVIVDEKALSNSSKATLSIDRLERGIYTLRIFNDEGQRIFKVVKQ